VTFAPAEEGGTVPTTQVYAQVLQAAARRPNGKKSGAFNARVIPGAWPTLSPKWPGWACLKTLALRARHQVRKGPVSSWQKHNAMWRVQAAPGSGGANPEAMLVMAYAYISTD